MEITKQLSLPTRVAGLALSRFVQPGEDVFGVTRSDCHSVSRNSEGGYARCVLGNSLTRKRRYVKRAHRIRRYTTNRKVQHTSGAVASDVLTITVWAGRMRGVRHKIFVGHPTNPTTKMPVLGH